MTHPKIQPTHQQRQAVIYVRQSTLRQLEENHESRQRQYQLIERAQALGWPAARCVVIDDDLGLSGAHSRNRPGYQRLIAMLALRDVGLILGLEVSRLARNCLDWYQLLELAATFDALIADEDGVYDQSDFNDRLLLGLKGTISEVERYQIHARLQRGRLNKARRGELIGTLPVGLEYDRAEPGVRLSADQSVRHALSHVFKLFRQLRSIRAVLHYLHRAQLELPHQLPRRAPGQDIRWQPPSYDALYALLTNTCEQMQAVIAQRDRWYSEAVTEPTKKELLRCLIEQVLLESRGKVIRARVCWYGGAVSELDVPKYPFSAPPLYHQIRELAQQHTDAEIAERLNQAGLNTVKNKPWTPRRVMDFRLSNAISSGFTLRAERRLPQTGYITSAEAATHLGVSQSTVQKWYRLGILSGKHDGGQALLWIRWTEDVGHRLAGGATPDLRMVSVRALCQTQGKRPDEVLTAAQQQGALTHCLNSSSILYTRNLFCNILTYKNFIFQ